MTKASKGYNGVVVPLFRQMISKIGQVQGEGSAIPAVPQHTPIVVPEVQHTPPVIHTFRRRSRQSTVIPQSSVSHLNIGADEAAILFSMDGAGTTVSGLDAGQDRANISKTPTMATPNVPSPTRLGTGGGIQSQRQHIGGSGVQSSPTRLETEFMLHDSPLLAGNTARSYESSATLQELMATCTNLTQQVSDLKLELALTKEIHAQDIQGLKSEIQGFKDQLATLQRKRTSKLIMSSSSHDSDSEPEGGNLGDSPKQGRKTDDQTQGRKLIFEEEAFDEGNQTQDFPTAQEVFTTGADFTTAQATEEHFDTASESLSTDKEDFELRSRDKGKGPMVMEETTQKKVKARVVAQMERDAELARQDQEEERARLEAERQRHKEQEVLDFLEAQRLQNEQSPQKEKSP